MSVMLREIVGRLSTAFAEMLSAVPARELSMIELWPMTSTVSVTDSSGSLNSTVRCSPSAIGTSFCFVLAEAAHGDRDRVRSDAHVEDVVPALAVGDGLVRRAGRRVRRNDGRAGKRAALGVGHDAREAASRRGLRAGRHGGGEQQAECAHEA